MPTDIDCDSLLVELARRCIVWIAVQALRYHIFLFWTHIPLIDYVAIVLSMTTGDDGCGGYYALSVVLLSLAHNFVHLNDCGS